MKRMFTVVATTLFLLIATIPPTNAIPATVYVETVAELTAAIADGAVDNFNFGTIHRKNSCFVIRRVKEKHTIRSYSQSNGPRMLVRRHATRLGGAVARGRPGKGLPL